MSNYSELLKDPRWQKKRLQIFSRDNFTCVGCSSQDKTLHVHHHYYIPGRMPWEYSDDLLVTLCEQCHANEEAFKECDDDVVKVLLCSGLLRYDLQKLIQLIHEKGGSAKPSYFRVTFDRALEKFRFKPKPKANVRLTDLLKK